VSDLDIRPAAPDLWPAIVELFSARGDARWCWYNWQVGASGKE
jgi:hypothetical protein